MEMSLGGSGSGGGGLPGVTGLTARPRGGAGAGAGDSGLYGAIGAQQEDHGMVAEGVDDGDGRLIGGMEIVGHQVLVFLLLTWSKLFF